MDISGEEHSYGLNKPYLVSVVTKIFSGIVTWLADFFTLTDENMSQAGIHLTKNGK